MPELDKLKLKATVKCRAFLFERIWDFRKPRTNVQVSCASEREQTRGVCLVLGASAVICAAPPDA